MLYQHQQKVLAKNESRMGIWHDTGLGKTITAINLVGHYPIRMVLIITTKSLKRNWENEINTWRKGKWGYVVMSKEEFRRDWMKLENFDALIVDEFHYFGNFKSFLHKSLWAWLKKNKPQYVWGLTATPIMSSCMSVWALSRLLGKPLGTYWEFYNKYFYKVRMGYKYVPMQKKGIEEALASDLRLVGDVVSKEEALDLPEQIHKFEYFGLTRDQKKAIKELDNDPTTANPIVYHNKVLQISNGTLKISSSSGEEGEKFKKFKTEKIPRLLELIERHRKVVVVARHTAELYLLREIISDSRLYHGGTPERDREKITSEFNSASAGVLLLQSDMAEGFSLRGVKVMIFYSHSYDYIKYYQSLGRIHGIDRGIKGQPAIYYHLLVSDTIDEAVWKCLERKESFDLALYQRK